VVAIVFMVLASVVSVLFVRSHVRPEPIAGDGQLAERAVVGH
jgi:hypothetical protein